VNSRGDINFSHNKSENLFDPLKFTSVYKDWIEYIPDELNYHIMTSSSSLNWIPDAI
jgi:hypothetical protein